MTETAPVVVSRTPAWLWQELVDDRHLYIGALTWLGSTLGLVFSGIDLLPALGIGLVVAIPADWVAAPGHVASHATADPALVTRFEGLVTENVELRRALDQARQALLAKAREPDAKPGVAAAVANFERGETAKAEGSSARCSKAWWPGRITARRSRSRRDCRRVAASHRSIPG